MSMEKIKRYLALGDSYTIGEGVPYEENFPSQLVRRLNENGQKVALDKIVAVTGWTTDELMSGIEGGRLSPPYDLVSLLIGVNNQFRGAPIETFCKEFKELLNQAIEFAGGDKEKVFVLSIPDYAFTEFGQMNDPFEISVELLAFNLAKKKISREIGVRYFDITPLTRQGLDEAGLVADDNLHPSAEMYRRWVNLMESGVKAML